jgi:hypothetical protein
VELLANIPDALLYFLPGFVGLKIFYTFGLKTARTDVEWAIWSVMASVLIYATTAPIRAEVGLSDTATATHVLLLLLACLLGAIGAVVWNRWMAPRWRGTFVVEPWDMAYHDAVTKKRQAFVELNDGREVQGDIAWMGLVSEGSSRAITLINVQISDGHGKWTALPPDEQLHVPEDAMHLLRLVQFEPR